LCGETSHFTNFALLLAGNGGGGGNADPCASSSLDYTLPYVSLGMVAGAICMVLIGILLVELRIRIRMHTRRKMEGVIHVVIDS
jgi:hypothetical protein